MNVSKADGLRAMRERNYAMSMAAPVANIVTAIRGRSEPAVNIVTRKATRGQPRKHPTAAAKQRAYRQRKAKETN